MKKATSFRLSDRAKDVLVEQAQMLSISQTAVIEILLRQNFGSHTPNIRIKSLLDFKNKWRERHPSPDQTFHAGFAAGWYAAQNTSERNS